jgi:hypothetical protein
MFFLNYYYLSRCCMGLALPRPAQTQSILISSRSGKRIRTFGVLMLRWRSYSDGSRRVAHDAPLSSSITLMTTQWHSYPTRAAMMTNTCDVHRVLQHGIMINSTPPDPATICVGHRLRWASTELVASCGTQGCLVLKNFAKFLRFLVILFFAVHVWNIKYI